MKKNLVVFWEMFKIALFVVGGGFAILAVADGVFSRKLKWTEEGEIVSRLPVFQMLPGIIAGHTAVYVGRKVGGATGAFFALLGVAVPSVAVFTAVSICYSKIPVESAALDAVFAALRAFVGGIIAAMTWKMWKKCIGSPCAFAGMCAALVAIGWLRWNPALVALAAAFAGLAAEYAPRRHATSGFRFYSSLWAVPVLFFKYGLVAFGGGYVLVPVYVADFVGESAKFLGLGQHEFANVMALTQMTPGPISVNCATFFGFRMGLADGLPAAAGVGYAVAATLSLMLPGAVLLYFALGSLEKFGKSRIVKGILSGVRPVTVAMMLNALWTFVSMSVVSFGDGEAVLDASMLMVAAFGAAAIFLKTTKIVAAMAASALLAWGLYATGVSGFLRFTVWCRGG